MVDAVGSGSILPVTVLVFTIDTGLSPSSVGLGLTVGGFVALALSPLAGLLIDQLGAKRALIGF